MNPLLRMAVSATLATTELVLTTALEGVRKINDVLAEDSRPRASVAAVTTSDPEVRGAGWRAPELGDLDGTAAILRDRRTAAVAARARTHDAAPTGDLPRPTRTRPPRKRTAARGEGAESPASAARKGTAGAAKAGAAKSAPAKSSAARARKAAAGASKSSQDKRAATKQSPSAPATRRATKQANP